MSIFDRYDNLRPDYIPNNMFSNISTPDTHDNTPPRVMYDLKNRFIGYSWYKSEKFDFKISIDKDMSNKALQVDIFTYKWEKIQSFSQLNTNTIIIPISLDLGLIPGVYYVVVKSIDDESTYVENKFIISVI